MNENPIIVIKLIESDNDKFLEKEHMLFLKTTPQRNNSHHPGTN